MRLIQLLTWLCSMITIAQSSSVSCSNFNTCHSTHPWPDTTNVTCTTRNSQALVWTDNGGMTLVFPLSTMLGSNVSHVNFTSGVSCTAYKTWVDEANQIIVSHMICTGLSGALTVSCKSDNDPPEVCSSVLENASCVTPSPFTFTNHSSSVPTPPATKGISFVVGVVVGGVVTVIIIAAIHVSIITIAAVRCGGREMNADTPELEHNYSNEVELLNVSATTVNAPDDSVVPFVPSQDATEHGDRGELTVGSFCRVYPWTAVSRSHGDDTDKQKETKSIMKAMEVNAGEVTADTNGEDSHQPYSKPDVQETCFTIPAIEAGSGNQNDSILKSECVTTSSVPETGAEESGYQEELSYKDVLLSDLSVAPYCALFEPGDPTARACVMIEPKKPLHSKDVFCPL